LILGDIADAPANLQRFFARIDSQDAHLAGVGFDQPQQRADGRGLAGAVAAEKRKRLSGGTRRFKSLRTAFLPKDFFTPRSSMTGGSLAGRASFMSHDLS